MATKAVKKKKSEPTPTDLLKKVDTVADSASILQKEIKTMTKIFTDNQKVLVSMKGMIDVLASTLEDIQKQAKQIDILEDDTQKLYAGLNQVRAQSNLISKINDQTEKLREEVGRVSKAQKSPESAKLHKQVEDSINAIQNNSKMIIKIAQRIDEVRDDLRTVSAKTDSFVDVGREVERLRDDIDQIAGKTSRIKANTQIIENLKRDLENVNKRAVSASSVNAELDSIKTAIDSVADKASKIDSLGGVLEGLRKQFETVSYRADAANSSMEHLKEMTVKIDRIKSEVDSLSQRADSAESVGIGLKSVQDDLSDFKRNIFDKTGDIEQKIIFVSDTLSRQDEFVSEFHKKSDKIFSELQSVKGIATKSSNDSAKEMMALLKLSEYQSAIRMFSESKYGGLKDLEKMATHTANIVSLFDSVSDAGEKMPVPSEITKWAVGKILDCADRWDVRFGDVYSILINTIGKNRLKESVRLDQIRDIYGIRGVDEIRGNLNL